MVSHTLMRPAGSSVHTWVLPWKTLNPVWLHTHTTHTLVSISHNQHVSLHQLTLKVLHMGILWQGTSIAVVQRLLSSHFLCQKSMCTRATGEGFIALQHAAKLAYYSSTSNDCGSRLAACAAAGPVNVFGAELGQGDHAQAHSVD